MRLNTRMWGVSFLFSAIRQFGDTNMRNSIGIEAEETRFPD